MNNFKKIGLSALAGSLVAVSVNAAEVSMSGGASVAVTSTADTNKDTFYQNDSITFTVSGETDGGLTITTKLELDGDAAGSGNDFDNRSVSIASDAMGTITFSGHGGDSVIGGWDSKSPSAYEEVWALTASSASTAVSNKVIAGFGGDNLWRYDSPSFGGAVFSASYQSATQGTAASGSESISSYSDMGVMISPEMVEGLTLGYAVGEHDETASILGLDTTTMFVTYAYGPVTVGYQTSEVDGPTTTEDDDSTEFGISYAVTDDFSVSYGEHELDLGSATAAGTDQESKGMSASYTMGGTTISASFNETDNIAGAAADDEDSMEIAVSFAF